MKKILLLALSVAALTACGGGGNKASGDKAEKVTDKQREQASQIISYTNDIIDYLNETGSWMRSNDSRLEELVETGSGGRWSNIMPFIPNPSVDHKDKGLDTPPSAMEKEDQTYFKETIAEYRKTFKQMQEDGQTLFKYIRNQDYKDDDYAKGKELSDKILAAQEYVTDTKKAMYDKIDEVTYEAEYIILSDHPLRDPIFTMKDEMVNFENLYSTFVLYNDKETTVEQVDSAYQAIFANVEKNKALYAEILEENGVKSDYDDFYESCDDALDTYRFSFRTYVKQNREIPESEIRTFTSNYNHIIGAYNSFND